MERGKKQTVPDANQSFSYAKCEEKTKQSRK
jgi:hypothetical protein